jgi:hypothetical protein
MTAVFAVCISFLGTSLKAMRQRRTPALYVSRGLRTVFRRRPAGRFVHAPLSVGILEGRITREMGMPKPHFKGCGKINIESWKQFNRLARGMPGWVFSAGQ